MKILRKAIAVSVLLVVVGGSAVSASPALKDGQACKKAGQTQKKAGSTFKCTKVGKKLVWKIASTNANAGGFGNGTHVVGTAVKPGRYITTTSSRMCYWERVSGFGGSFDEIIANESADAAHLIVDILATDKGFKTNGCGTWIPYTPKPPAKLIDGTWAVNDEIAPGLWQASKSDRCYWERVSDFTSSFGSIIANEYEGGIAQIDPTDIGFTSSGCGTWTKVG
jgi:hypothetical protein